MLNLDSKQEINKLIAELDYWIFIGIGDDIVTLKDQRPEYNHLVDLAKKRNIKTKQIPKFVLKYLKLESKKVPILTKTFWALCMYKLKTMFK